MKHLDNLVQDRLAKERMQYQHLSSMLGKFKKPDKILRSQELLKKKEDDYVTFLNRNYPVGYCYRRRRNFTIGQL